ncbi:MAG: tripartite tricarboxylate transporter TctB family protein [Firmicutes bacterium]|nr:tripartite tricarboxylate transporter TctB family protein [Bacillota bacterium]
MDKSRATLLVALGSILFSLFILHESTTMPDFGVSYKSPATMPVFIGIVMAISAILVGFEGHKSMPKREAGAPLFTWPKLSDPGFRRFLVIFVMTVLYVVAVPYLHFTITSIIFLGVTFYLYRIGSPLKMAAITLVSVFAIQFMFQNVFRTLLP